MIRVVLPSNTKVGELLGPCDFRNDVKPPSSEINDYVDWRYTSETYEKGARVYILAEYSKPTSNRPYMLLMPYDNTNSQWRAVVPSEMVRVVSPLELLAWEAE